MKTELLKMAIAGFEEWDAKHDILEEEWVKGFVTEAECDKAYETMWEFADEASRILRDMSNGKLDFTDARNLVFYRTKEVKALCL